MRAAQPQLLVIGAGPVGLATALFARRAGIAVRVVDKAEGPSRFSKAIGLQYRVSELLDLLGLSERFLAAGARPGMVNMRAEGRLLLRLAFADFSALAGRGAFAPVAIMLPQSDTERLFAAALGERGGAIEWQTEFVGLTQDGAGVVAELRRADGSVERAAADWLVGCDGAHSAVRKAIGLDFAGTSYPLAFVIADVDSDWPADRDGVHVWFHADGSAAAMPLPGARRWRLFLETTRQSFAGEPSEAELRHLLAARVHDAAADLGAVVWRSEFRINCRMVARLRVGRAFLAGDAAHIHSPTGGQGITTGVQDAANLAWKLGAVAGGAPDALLDSYGEERLDHARKVLAETDRNTRIFVGTTPLLRLLRDRLVLPLLRRAFVQRRLVRRLSQLDLGHRGSALARPSAGARRGARLRPGDRAPDVLFRRGDNGEALTLFRLLGVGRCVALIAAPAAPGIAEALERLDIRACIVAGPGVASGAPGEAGIALADAHGDFARLYRLAARRLCIVRPDGFIGFVGEPGDGLREWLGLIRAPETIARAFAGDGDP
jgi:4,5-epoxidase